MKQTDSFITIAKSFEDIKHSIRVVAKESGIEENQLCDVMYSINRLEIIQASNQEEKRTGKKLSKELKLKLASKYKTSPKRIEKIIYNTN